MVEPRKTFFFVFCAILGAFLLACALGGVWALKGLSSGASGVTALSPDDRPPGGLPPHGR